MPALNRRTVLKMFLVWPVVDLLGCKNPKAAMAIFMGVVQVGGFLLQLADFSWKLKDAIKSNSSNQPNESNPNKSYAVELKRLGEDKNQLRGATAYTPFVESPDWGYGIQITTKGFILAKYQRLGYFVPWVFAEKFSASADKISSIKKDPRLFVSETGMPIDIVRYDKDLSKNGYLVVKQSFDKGVFYARYSKNNELAEKIWFESN